MNEEITSYYYCYSKYMSKWLEAQGCECVRHYFSKVDDREIYLFPNSRQTWNCVNEYTKQYQAYLAGKESNRYGK